MIYLDEVKLKLNEIIENAKLDSELKSCLKKSLNAIYEHEKTIISEIKTEVETELKKDRQQNTLKIATALVPKKEISAMNERKFYIINENEKSSSVFFQKQSSIDKISTKDYQSLYTESYFLQCPYEEIDEICRKIYRGYSSIGNFDYKIVTHKRFIEQENKLFRLSELYNINKPLIFSPYARRAVDICILNDYDEVDLKTIDFEFENNYLKDKIIDDYVLMWNILISSNSSSNSYIAPDEDDIHHRYIYNSGIDKNTFILPSAIPNISFEVNKISNERIDIITSDEIRTDKCEIFKIFDEKDIDSMPNSVRIFWNTCENEQLFNKVRLRTVGDINYVLNTLQQGEFSCTFDKWSDQAPENQIKIYQKSRRHNYFIERNEQLMKVRSKLPKCCIKFNAPAIYLTDYANFVLNFLEQNYPEYFWVGVS